MVDVIENGTQLWSSPPVSPVSTFLTLRLLSRETRPLYSAVSVWTGDTVVAPSGCTSPTQATILPNVDTGMTHCRIHTLILYTLLKTGSDFGEFRFVSIFMVLILVIRTKFNT